MEKVFLTEHIHPDAVAYLRENFEVVQGTSTERSSGRRRDAPRS